VLLPRAGGRVNHQRGYRLYRLAGLSLRLKTRKQRVGGLRGPKPAATRPNACWSMDSMADRLVDGRPSGC
jgi:putative transposase